MVIDCYQWLWMVLCVINGYQWLLWLSIVMDVFLILMVINGMDGY